jgi:hypothetical protein
LREIFSKAIPRDPPPTVSPPFAARKRSLLHRAPAERASPAEQAQGNTHRQALRHAECCVTAKIKRNFSFFYGGRQFMAKIRLHYTSKESIIGTAGQGNDVSIFALAPCGESNLR